VQKLLKASYENPKSGSAPTGYQRDSSLSGKRVQVYTNEEGKAFVVHRGTAGMHDMLTDLKFTTNSSWFKSSKRYKHSQEIQKLAHEKYGKENTTALGHSLGGALAETTGRKSSQIITLNKASNPKFYYNDKRRLDHQVDIYSTNDAVSKGAHHQKGGKAIVIEAKTMDPLKEHGTDILDRITGTVEKHKTKEKTKTAQDDDAA